MGTPSKGLAVRCAQYQRVSLLWAATALFPGYWPKRASHILEYCLCGKMLLSKIRLAGLLLLAGAIATATFPQPAAIVHTKAGSVAGTQIDQWVSQWKGIPFAAPPTGDLRFRPPQPVKAWAPKVLDTTEFKHNCLQKPGSHMGWPQPLETQSEDCES